MMLGFIKPKKYTIGILQIRKVNQPMIKIIILITTHSYNWNDLYKNILFLSFFLLIIRFLYYLKIQISKSNIFLNCYNVIFAVITLFVLLYN